MNHEAQPLTVYGVYPYDRGAKTRWLLAEMGVPYQNHWMDTEKGEMDSAEYQKINPMGRVPALTLGTDAIFESGAMCMYLADLYLDKGLAPAVNSVERRSYLQWMFFAASTLDPMQSRIMIIEDITETELMQKKQTVLLEELSDAVATLAGALEHQQFLVKNQFSAADICVSYHLFWLTLWPEMASVIEASPVVATYLARMKSRASAISEGVFAYPG